MTVESSAGSLTEQPTLEIERDGVIRQADDTALALPGMSLDVVRVVPRRSFATEPTDPRQSATLPTQWVAGGRSGVVGFTTTRRPTHEPVRGGTAILPPAPSPVASIGDVLGVWRAAERRLETIDFGSPEYESTIAEITELRAQYQRLFEARLRDA